MRAANLKWLLALLLSTGAISSAQAKLIDLERMNERAYFFDDSFTGNRVLNDGIVFSLDAPAQIDGLIASLGILLDPFSKIRNFGMALSSPTSWQTASTGNLYATAFPWATLLPRSYEFAISGKSAGAKHDAYLGSFTANSVAPVRETDTYIMLLAGIALVGYQLRRKQRALEQQPLVLG